MNNNVALNINLTPTLCTAQVGDNEIHMQSEPSIRELIRHRYQSNGYSEDYVEYMTEAYISQVVALERHRQEGHTNYEKYQVSWVRGMTEDLKELWVSREVYAVHWRHALQAVLYATRYKPVLWVSSMSWDWDVLKESTSSDLPKLRVLKLVDDAWMDAA